jgi:hypothetical protein
MTKPVALVLAETARSVSLGDVLTDGISMFKLKLRPDLPRPVRCRAKPVIPGASMSTGETRAAPFGAARGWDPMQIISEPSA